MFRFQHTDHLYALVAIPLLVVLFWIAWRQRKQVLKKLGEWMVVSQLIIQDSSWMRFGKFVLFIAGLFFLIIGWANPQWGTKKEKVIQRSADVMIALDISESMLAQDISPDRLDRAKQFALQLVDQLAGNRIGLVLFAGKAYMQTPLTTDFSAVQASIRSVNTEQAPTQGTSFQAAVELARQSFEEDKDYHKAIIMISDGENHEEGAIAEAKEAQEDDTFIFTVGVGTSRPTSIPIFRNGRSDFKRDRTGNVVKTQFDPQALSDLAEAGGGRYFPLTQGDQILSELEAVVDRLEKQEVEERLYSEYESYFQYFLLVAFIFLFLEWLLPERKLEWRRGAQGE